MTKANVICDSCAFEFVRVGRFEEGNEDNTNYEFQNGMMLFFPSTRFECPECGCEEFCWESELEQGER